MQNPNQYLNLQNIVLSDYLGLFPAVPDHPLNSRHEVRRIFWTLFTGQVNGFHQTFADYYWVERIAMIMIFFDNLDEQRNNPRKYPELAHPRAMIFARLAWEYVLSDPRRDPILFLRFMAMHCGVLNHLDMIFEVCNRRMHWIVDPTIIPHWP